MAGEHAALGLDGGQIFQSLLNDRALRLLDANAGRCSPCVASCSKECATPPDDDSLTGELLNPAANLYFKRLGEGESTIRDLFHYHPVLTIGEGLTRSGLGVLYLFDRPYAVTPKGPLLDVHAAPTVSTHIAGKSDNGVSFRRLIGINSSAQEHALWEELLAVESVSTIKILEVANSAGVTVRLRDPGDEPIKCKDGVVRPFFGCGAASGCLETCGVNPGLISLICSDLADGRLITAPECPITLNQWSGFGWITETPAHDAWGYLISGGISAEEIIGSAITEPPKLSSTAGVVPADAATVQAQLAALPTYTIDLVSIQSLLTQLTLPEPLRQHIQQLVAAGAVVTLSEAVLNEAGREVLLFSVKDPITGRTSYFYYDLAIGGGAGSENPPKPLPGSASNTGDGQGVTTAGDPVNVANGNFVRTEVDFTLPALPNALAFTRTYNSLLTDDIGLGAGWTHGYGERLDEETNGTVTWTNTRGGHFSFTPDGKGGYITPANLSDTNEKLQRTPSGWQLRSKHGMTRDFAPAGHLIARRDRNGNAESLSYDAAGRLASVTDAAGRALTVGSQADGHIATVSDFTGRTWRYTYDGARLVRVEGPSDGTTQPIVTSYAYFDGPLNRDRLQRVSEPNGGVLSLEYYTNHRIFQVTDPVGGISTFTYQLLQNQTDYVDPQGFRTRYRYNDLGNVEAIEYPDGEIERWTWVNHQVTSHTDPLGHLEAFRYDGSGNLISATDATGIEATFEYEPVFAKPTRVSLPGGRETSLTYDSRGNPTGIRDAEGGVRLLEWDEHGLPVRITDARGNAITRQFNSAGQLTAQQTPLPSQETVDYTPRGRAQVHTDANLHPTSFVYDLLDRLTESADAEGGVARRAYDGSGRLVASTDARGATTRFEYDLLDRLVRITHPDKTATVFDYDPAGNLVAVTDALGRVSRHTYDSRRRRVGTNNPDGSHVAYRFDAADRLVGITDALGHTTGYAYDAAGRLVSTTDALGHTTHADYDEVGNLASLTDRRGAVSRLLHDRLNRLTQVSRDGGYLATLDYDANGNLVARARYDIAGLSNVPSDPRLLPPERRQQNTWTYDVLNRVLSFVDGENAETAYRYDPVGNLIGSTDPLGQTTTWEHDRLNRVTAIAYPDGGRLKAAYDPVGNRISVTTPQGGIYRWGYDTRNRVITATDPLRKITGFAYDAVGNLVHRTHPDGSWVAQQYDAMNRPQRLTRSDNTSIDYGYDAVGNLVSAVTADIESTFDHDPLNRVLNETTRFLSNGYKATVGYAYDAEGNLATVTDPLQRTIRYDYDPLPALTGVAIEGQGLVARIARDGFQRRAEVELGNGIHESYRYDRNDRITAIDAGANIAQLSYTRDRVGNPVAIAESLGGVAEKLSLAYDPMYRPTQVSASVAAGGRGESIKYDLNGNLVRMQQQQGISGNGKAKLAMPTSVQAGAKGTRATRVRFNRADQPVRAGNARYRYDAAGNRLDSRMAGNRRLAMRHNASQQLTSLQEFGRNRLQRKADLIYDGLGRLVELRDNGTTRRIIHAFENRLLELDANGAPLIAYTMGPTTDDTFSVAIAGQTRYLHRDLINSVRAATDAAGQVVATRNYSLFGQVQTTSGEPSPIGFAGRPQDQRTGLMEFRARWYDPQRGQFVERDPLAALGIYSDATGVQFNLYGYANSRPSIFGDPMGTKPANLIDAGKALLKQFEKKLLEQTHDIDEGAKSSIENVKLRKCFGPLLDCAKGNVDYNSLWPWDKAAYNHDVQLRNRELGTGNGWDVIDYEGLDIHSRLVRDVIYSSIIPLYRPKQETLLNELKVQEQRRAIQQIQENLRGQPYFGTGTNAVSTEG